MPSNVNVALYLFAVSFLTVLHGNLFLRGSLEPVLVRCGEDDNH